jgi:hypothetical protein
LKSPEETLEQRQQRSNRYKDLLIISAPVKDDADESSSVLCLITLPEAEDDQSLDTSMAPLTKQLTIRIDVDGKIVKVDTTQLILPQNPPQYSQYASFLTKEIGQDIIQLVHPQDRQKLVHHLKHVIQQGPPDAQTLRYRLMIAPDQYVHTEVQSRFFRNDGTTGEADFVMAVHEILSDNEILGGGSSSIGMDADFSALLPNMNHTMSSQSAMLMKQQNSGIGGPLLGSSGSGVMNGGSLSQISPRNQFPNDNSLIPPTFNDPYFQSEPFDFGTFDIENQLIDSRPESRASMTSVSTPRPSSATAAFSPIAAPLCASPLTPYSQPSPASITNNNNTTMTNNNLTTSSNATCVSNNNNNNSNSSSGFNSAGSNQAFQFPFEDSKEKVQEELQKMQQENNNSGRLRNLLMKSPSVEDELRGNQILKVNGFELLI